MAYMTPRPDKGGYPVWWRPAPFDAEFVALRIGENDPPARPPTLAEGEKLLDVTYARSGSTVYILCEFAALAICVTAMFAAFEPLIYASGGAVALFAVLAATTWKLLGLAVTNRRLILSRAAFSQRLIGSCSMSPEATWQPSGGGKDRADAGPPSPAGDGSDFPACFIHV